MTFPTFCKGPIRLGIFETGVLSFMFPYFVVLRGDNRYTRQVGFIAIYFLRHLCDAIQCDCVLHKVE